MCGMKYLEARKNEREDQHFSISITSLSTSPETVIQYNIYIEEKWLLTMFFYFRIFRFVMISWFFFSLIFEKIDWGQNKDLYLSSLHSITFN